MSIINKKYRKLYMSFQNLGHMLILLILQEESILNYSSFLYLKY
jgi:hypothetical protein